MNEVNPKKGIASMLTKARLLKARIVKYLNRSFYCEYVLTVPPLLVVYLYN
ncbi:MAG: hypothetical protein ACI9T9_002290 [Oleiphilaceae bacterium]|jgi:hypothetical protein